MKYQSIIVVILVGSPLQFWKVVEWWRWVRTFQQWSHGHWAALLWSTWILSIGCGSLMFADVHYSVHEGINTSVLDQVLFYTCKKKKCLWFGRFILCLGSDTGGTVAVIMIRACPEQVVTLQSHGARGVSLDYSGKFTVCLFWFMCFWDVGVAWIVGYA